MTKDNSLLPIEILILESAHTTDNSLNIAVPGLPYYFKKTNSQEQMLQALKDGDYPLVMLNVENEWDNLAGTINRIKINSPDTQIIVIANTDNRLNAECAANAGCECLFRPVTVNLLISKIRNACEIVRSKNELMMLRQQVAMNYAFDNLVGASPEIQKVKRTIQHTANNRTTVILSGEKGTGKNLTAGIIHYHSPDRNNPFVIINCQDDSTAIAQMAEKQLTKGTLFIDNLHLADQAAMLNLQRQIVQGLAGEGANVRLIMSINEPLYDMFAKRVIDRKLIEGLNAIEISLPSLRERTEDIEPLVFYFLRMISFNNNTPTTSITPSALAALKSHQWPGNVSELNSCLRRAAAVCANNCIDVTELQLATSGSATFRERAEIGASSNSGSLEENQRRLITNALNANEWNFSQTAIQLGIGRTTLWRKVRKFNLMRLHTVRLDTESVSKRGAEVVSDFEPAV